MGDRTVGMLEGAGNGTYVLSGRDHLRREDFGS